MTKRRAMLGLVVTAAVAGVFGVFFNNAGRIAVLVQLGLVLAVTSFVFIWMHFDSIEIGFHRSPLLNAAVFALPIVFFPVYLARSRPKGSRLQALCGCVAFFALLVLVAAASSFGAFLFGGLFLAT